jgi:nitrogen regulatory protein PII
MEPLIEKFNSSAAVFRSMKRVELYVPQERLEAINELLHKHNVGGITCYDITGRGRSMQESKDVERGTRSFIPEFGRRLKIEVIVENSLAKRVELENHLRKMGIWRTT